MEGVWPNKSHLSINRSHDHGIAGGWTPLLGQLNIAQTPESVSSSVKVIQADIRGLLTHGGREFKERQPTEPENTFLICILD